MFGDDAKARRAIDKIADTTPAGKRRPELEETRGGRRADLPDAPADIDRPSWPGPRLMAGFEGYVAKDEATCTSAATTRWLKVRQKAWDGRGGRLVLAGSAQAISEGWHLVVNGDDGEDSQPLSELTSLLI